MRPRRALSLLAFTTSLLAASLVVGVTRADGGNAAIAEGLFADAKRLLDQGKADLACPKFAESLRLDPTLGTRLNLAHCYEVQGKTATAWGEYKEVARTAGSDTKRFNIAKERIAAIEPTLAHATITGAADVGVKIKLDGKALDAAILGTPFSIDPGDHALELSAPNKQTRTVDFHVDAAQSTSVELPALDNLTATTPEVVKVAGPKTENDVPHDEVSLGKRIGGWVAIGGGVAVVGVGAVFGILTLSLASDVSNLCKTGCSQEGIDKNSTAHTDALLSDIFIPVGLVAIGVGTYLVLTATHHVTADVAKLRVTPIVGSHAGGLAIGGRF